jgi:hypothetical protein
MAADIKVTFVLFGLGIAWAARRSVRTVLAAAAGGLAVLVPSYLWFGPPAITVLLYRDAGATSDNLYQLFSRPFGLARPPDLILLVVPLLVAVGWLLLRRLPDGAAGWPAIRPALALSLAWLLVWPYQRPWYDAMVFCLLAVFPASRLDWPVLARLAAGTLYSLPGMPGPLPAVLGGFLPVEQRLVVPVIRLAALAAVIVLCLTGAWHARPREGPPAPRWPRGRRPISARIPAGTAPVRAAYAPADAPPAPDSGAAGRPGTARPAPPAARWQAACPGAASCAGAPRGRPPAHRSG